MLKNYIKIALRNISRSRVYSFINIIGLSLCLVIGVLILLFITDETGFDRFHTNGDRIYKIVTPTSVNGGMETNSWPVAYKLKSEFPEVEEVVYTRQAFSSMLVNHEGKRFEHNLYFADNAFFNMFSFEFIEGTPQKALSEPYSIVMTRSMRDRYFGSANALGQILTLRDSMEFKVTGVVEDIPKQSHIQFDALISFATYEQLDADFNYSDGWGNFNVRNYLMLRDGADINEFSAKAENLYRENIGEMMDNLGVELSLAFIPLEKIYLNETYYNGFGPNGSMDQVYLVGAIALFVILLGCINYINLSTARSVYRAREVGLRKIAGSSRSTIFWQFQVEVFVITLLSFLLSGIVLEFALPFFNDLMGKSYTLSSLLEPKIIAGALILILFITFLAGFYPSRILSSYQPSDVFKVQMGRDRKGVNLRRILVIVQFSISGMLVLGTFIVLEQLNFMRNQDLGFDKEQVLVLDVTRVPKTSSLNVLQNNLKQLAGVEQVSFTNALPGRPGWQGQWAYPEGVEEAEGNQVDTEYMAIDENYIATLGLELLAGENFDQKNPAALSEGLIINETTVKEMGWETPENAIGKRIVSPSGTPAGLVIGVVKDYHGVGLQGRIWPKAMGYTSSRYGRYFAIRFVTGNTSNLISDVQNSWQENLGDYTFEFFFLDQEFDKQYRSEDRLMKVFTLFAVLTLVLSAIGLLGLVSFMIISRTREIGIRKVLGANTMGLVTLLSKEFIFLVFIANILIIPLVWWAANLWLNNFAYHMEVNPWIFAVSIGAMVLLAMGIVFVQTFTASRQNPIDTIRVE
ncbi:ABC transporter permease [Fulvivirga sedimenti]|uniref:ABC transporter permease n=1 Tax=Fulvivirga sedimenti TaxID=2879465 RepID=A0A9X1HVK0_9BACT|nr:ABC transporter permease [Fulvivirga sedimenti]MCA6079063.1 ABC transporter permease [Fulvivirga sedimenti]